MYHMKLSVSRPTLRSEMVSLAHPRSAQQAALSIDARSLTGPRMCSILAAELCRGSGNTFVEEYENQGLHKPLA